MFLHVAVCRSSEPGASIVAEAKVSVDDDVTIGAPGDSAAVAVPGWSEEPLLLVEDGRRLHLGPGMRVNMCDAQGRNRIVGEYDELVAAGTPLPIEIAGRSLNVRVRPGLSVFVKHLPARSACGVAT